MALLIAALLCSCRHSGGGTVKTVGKGKADMMSAEVSFADTIYDFGTVHSAEPVQKHVFTFTNMGQVPAVILNATPSCHCISVDYTKEAIMPGKTGEVTVTFNGTDQTFGWFDKSVRLRFNSKRLYTLSVRGELFSDSK